MFADADYPSKATDRMSVSGEAVMCAGACVYWFFRTQMKCVTLFTTEAAYVALAGTIKLMFIRYVFRFMSTRCDVHDGFRGYKNGQASSTRTGLHVEFDACRRATPFLRELFFGVAYQYSSKDA